MSVPESIPLTDYSPDGVDLTLIRWFLSLTPAERLEFHERQMEDILAIRKWRTTIPGGSSGLLQEKRLRSCAAVGCLRLAR